MLLSEEIPLWDDSFVNQNIPENVIENGFAMDGRYRPLMNDEIRKTEEETV